MAQSSQANDALESRSILEGQLRECYGRVVYSHKTHELCSDILLGKLSSIKLWQIVLSAVTTCGFITVFFGYGTVGISVGVLASTVLLILNTYTKDYDLGELAQKHKQAAIEIWHIREKYLSLITDLAMAERPLAEITQERDTLLGDLNSVYSGAPSTNHKAYRKAQKALQKDDDMTFTATEIDAFLPDELKRGQ
jgi:hypothetical protein